MENKYVLRTVDLNKEFGGRHVVSDVNLKVREGDVYGLLGLNGAGKTTTLKLILGFLNPTSGNIFIRDHLIHRDMNGGLKCVGAMIESPAFYENLSGRKNFQLMAGLYGEKAVRRVDTVLGIVEMEWAADKKVREYSLGMKQRLAIGRAFLNDPDLIILDEPTNGLDPYGMKAIRELILKLAREYGKTFIVSTHLLNEAEMMCNTVGIIHNGRLIREFSQEEVRKMKSSGSSLEDEFLSLTGEERMYV